MDDTLPRHTIGALAKATGTTVETIRYYERIGVVPRPMRTAGGHRLYTTAQLKRLHFVRRARELGFRLTTVRRLLALADGEGGGCARVEAVARDHREQVRTRIRDLQALDAVLGAMIAECARGAVPDCPAIEVLYGEREAPLTDASRRPGRTTP